MHLRRSAQYSAFRKNVENHLLPLPSRYSTRRETQANSTYTKTTTTTPTISQLQSRATLLLLLHPPQKGGGSRKQRFAIKIPFHRLRSGNRFLRRRPTSWRCRPGPCRRTSAPGRTWSASSSSRPSCRRSRCRCRTPTASGCTFRCRT